MSIDTRIHNVTKVEKTVRVYNEGSSSEFTVVELLVRYQPYNAPEHKLCLTLFVDDDANALDVIGDGEFNYVKC